MPKTEAQKRAAQKWEQNNRQKVNEKSKRWNRKNPEWRAAYSRSTKAKSARAKYESEHIAERIISRRARDRVRNAIKAGRLVRALICDQCGSDGFIEAAHSDYSKPLDVRWLCRSCHRAWDKRNPKISGTLPIPINTEQSCLE